DHASFGGLDVLRPAAPAQQRVPDVLTQEVQIGLIVDLVADHRDRHRVVGGVLGVLLIDRDAAQCRFADQEGAVEPSEHPGGERLGTGHHVHNDVFPGTVHQVVEQQLHGTHFGVIAGYAEVV